ncbi:putative DsbA family dithiol-disulfide isomerase [Leucobacter exalbidus]|uniref:DsbA family dithiol-disulfide isomerase n=1 Tax=Leucobacter exalbidus TaxID=662960 RepID=A0A940T3B0_9MICO|nr:putative DsbA family dithiol-disulfide isomerase [Leucobacter exalbidus]
MTKTIRVEIWSDIACPWCFIGKHRFDAGVAAFRADHPEVSFEVSSHSFELAPDTPLDFQGSEVEFLVQHKGMPADQVEQMLGQMTELAASEGLEFDFTQVKHANTRRAHRMLHLAREQGVQAAVQERLFKAYFGEGQDMSDADTLARIGAEAGLDADQVRAALNDDAYGAKVDADITRAQMLGVTGVPFFLLESKYGISGAQTADAFQGAFAQVLELEAEASAAS